MNIAVDARILEARHGRGVPGPERPRTPAHVIRDDAEAIGIAQDLARTFRAGAAERDRAHTRPLEQVDAFSQSGLWSINVPAAFGGPEVSYRTLAQVIAIVSAADPSIGQIAQNHLGIVAAIRTVSDEAQKRLLFGEVLRGIRFGNAFSEKSTRRAADFGTRFSDHGDHVVVHGQKFYATGALLAHLVPIVAVDDRNRAWYAIAERDAPGLTVIDDWSSFGQRGTASGTVLIEDVRVEKTTSFPPGKPTRRRARMAPCSRSSRPPSMPASAVPRSTTRSPSCARRRGPGSTAGRRAPRTDPYTIQAIGDLTIRQHAAEALLDRAGLSLDAAIARPDAESVAAAQVAVAEAKVLTTEVALAAANKLFELSGTRSTLADENLDRHRRNARTHTLHDPVRWKYAIVGNHALNGVAPPAHAWTYQEKTRTKFSKNCKIGKLCCPENPIIHLHSHRLPNLRMCYGALIYFLYEFRALKCVKKDRNSVSIATGI